MTTGSLKLSKPLKVNLSVYRGDSGHFLIGVRDDNNAPIDVSSATWRAEIRLNTEDIVITSFDIVPVVGDSSKIDIILTAEKAASLPSSCVYDIEMTLNSEVITLVYGNIGVTRDVSRPS